MKIMGTLILVALAGGCAGGGSLGVEEEPRTEREVALDIEFTMAVHDLILVEGTNVLIFFDGVTGDSRCPIGVDCVWEGNAAVRLEFSSRIAEFAPQPRILNTALEPRSVDFMGVTVRLVEVAPYPREGDPPIDPANYVVKLVVTQS